MPTIIIDELKQFIKNGMEFKNKYLLLLIIFLIILPIIYISKIKEYFKTNINNAIRFLTVYLINIYHLILIYNSQVIELFGDTNNDIIINEVRRNNAPVRPFDILQLMAENVGIDLNNLIDIEIIQIEPNFANNMNEHIENNDNQNVHDTSIQSHITNCINKLKEDKWKECMKLTNTELLNDIKKYIFNEYKTTDLLKKENAIITLNKIKKINGKINKLNITELEILKLVWNRINNPVNKDKINIIKDNLIEALIDCNMTDETLYCVQGRVGRIIQCLECSDNEDIVNLKPLWVIKEEIGNYCAKYRNKIYNSLSESQKIIYNKLNPSSKKEIALVKKINNLMYNKINNKLKLKYLNSNIINNEQYKKITEPFFAEFN